MGQCPKCGFLVLDITIEEITINHHSSPQCRSIAYLCPHCRSILGVQIDPVALKSDLRKEILNELRGGTL